MLISYGNVMGYTIKVQRFADLPSILCNFKSLYKHFGMMLGRSFFLGGAYTTQYSGDYHNPGTRNRSYPSTTKSNDVAGFDHCSSG